jgi:Kef-type K+ transport system membrane component KefB
MQSLASIGVTLLLFMIGLELKLTELKSVGKPALIAGGAQVLLVSSAAFLLSRFLGFSTPASFYIALGLSFSSTIVVIKLLSDKKDLNSLYGKLVTGILVVQDILAIFLLIFLSAVGGAGSIGAINVNELLVTGLKVVVLFGWVIVLSRELLPRVLNRVSRSSESLFLFSLAWVFGIAAFVSSPLIGFSIEIGGLLAGLALANSVESYQIVTKVKPLRDFFITIFFVTLGMNMVFSDISKTIAPILILTAFVILITPDIIMLILGSMSYKKRTSFFTAITLTQISEFSLILVYLGQKLGHVSQEVVGIITFVGVITFTVSTYLITNSNELYRFFMPFLDIFERDKTKPEEKSEISDHTILVGANRLGEGILDALLDKKENLLVVDFDPDIIEKLNRKKIKTFFGDISDPEIQELVSLEKANLIISTVSDPEDTLLLLKNIRKLKIRKPKVIVAAFEKEDAKDFYKAGADYVIMPHIAGGHHLAGILIDDKRLELIERYKKREQKLL